jgi:hypothetical protein
LRAGDTEVKNLIYIKKMLCSAGGGQNFHRRGADAAVDKSVGGCGYPVFPSLYINSIPSFLLRR